MWHVAVLILSLSSLVYGAPQVPCYFIFGDSLYDNGNNNALITKAKANYPPYGIDFPTGPVGRFTNGRNTADILAKLLGFETYIPPFANASGRAILKGVNYASGAAGIRDETGQHMGARISFNTQLINHQITLLRIKIIAAAPNPRKCLYTVGFGNNDYISNYFSPFYLTRRIFTPEQYATLLIQQYSLQLKTLYNSKARKVAVFGIGAVGCTPAMVTLYGTNGSLCVDFINNAVQLFNAKLVSLVDDFNNNLRGAKFIYINSYQIALTPTPTTGLSITNVPCCNATNTISFQCIPNRIPCPNRNNYVFWDAVHPTEAADEVTTRRAYTALLPQDTHPSDIRTLAAS